MKTTMGKANSMWRKKEVYEKIHNHVYNLHMICQTCKNELIGRQTKFCSLECKNKDTNGRHKNYVSQQIRGQERKMELVRLSGGACKACGYNKSLAALSFHHRNPKEKEFQLDIRSLSNRTMNKIMREFEKCDLLCANCHMELHYDK